MPVCRQPVEKAWSDFFNVLVSCCECIGLIGGLHQIGLANRSRVERGFDRIRMRLDGSEDISPVVFWDEGAQRLLYAGYGSV